MRSHRTAGRARRRGLRGFLPAFVLVMVVSGCAAGYRVGVGVLADMHGRAGPYAYVGGTAGFLTSRRSALVEVFQADLGGRFEPSAGDVAPTIGLDYVHQHRDIDFGWRLGLRGRISFLFEAEDILYEIGTGGAVAFLAHLDSSRRRYEQVGGELSAWFVQSITTDAPGYVLLALGAVYEVDMFTPLDDLFSIKK